MSGHVTLSSRDGKSASANTPVHAPAHEEFRLKGAGAPVMTRAVRLGAVLLQSPTTNDPYLSVLLTSTQLQAPPN